MACVLACIVVLFNCAYATSLINFEPIDDSAGLMFERIGVLRHVTEQRFLFVQTIDYDPLLQELTKILNFARDTRNNATDCSLVKPIKPSKPSGTIARINKYLSSLTQLNNEYVRYTLNSEDRQNNEVYYDINIEYVDAPQTDTVDAHNPPHWSKVSAADVKAVLAAPSRKHVKMLTPILTADNVTTHKYLKYEECMNKNRCAANECLYLKEMHSIMNSRFIENYYVNTLDRLIKQTGRNKLNATNYVLDDKFLLHEMQKLEKNLTAHNLSWAVDFKRERNARFDLSQAYKLHLYANKNMVVLCIAMPLVDTAALKYSLYKVATVPFCRGSMCLMMVPAANYVAVTNTRNFYTYVPADFTTRCKRFTGYDDLLCPAADSTTRCERFTSYDEFLCPASRRVATLDSGLCEIEMFMGRYANDIDSLCNVRIADNNAKQVLLGVLVNNRKWIYAFSNNATVNYSCNGHYDAVLNVPAGVGLVTAQSQLICSVSVNRDAVTFNVDTRSNVTNTRSYWPKNCFNYNNYVNASLLSTPLTDAVTDLSVQQLKKLRSRFYIRDYTAPPNSYFSPRRNDVGAHEPPTQNKVNVVVLVSVLMATGAFSALCVLGVYCACKRYCMHKRCSVVVSFTNDDYQPMVAISNSARANLNIDMPQNNVSKYEKALLFPMEIHRTNNKFV
ncbi:F-protein [Choristoneura rosaceana nucleopolyhedrovirus]|uniref:F-protein n=1 Tax=Choristoneura rosaceana nucleopolyhedrovirus TaxID=58094 RepID=S5MRA2_9ABAC|nr:F-protein [Choristoneura rosaceana nucleopolyhedrovirus]AGR57168.1 F-protein [Choristoneura rosaceana nucleopolyhedrovirus]